MRSSKAIILAGVAAVAAIGAVAQKGPLTSKANPWPALVATGLPDEPPALSPTDALKTFSMPPGWHLELVASEPLVQDPIIAEYDGNGRLWVLELPGFANGENMENIFEPIADLVVLEDTNNDGVFDKRTVFADKLVMPRAFKVLDKGCALIGEPPNLWKACDSNGDLKADNREKISDSFARQGVIEHGANGLYWGMDNSIYVSEHSWNVAFKDGKFSTVPTLTRGQWGVTQDDGGRIYRNVNTDPLFVDYVPGAYFTRNPDMVRTRGLYETLAKQEDTQIWPAHPTRGVNRGYRTEVTREDGSSSYYQGVSSPMIYRGDRLPKEFYGQAFVVDSPTNIVHLLSLKDDGAGNFAAADYYKKGEFIASTDERFRPTWLVPGWDGSFLVVDMYRGVSQDGPLQTDYLRSYIKDHKLWQGIHFGRIYRVVRDGMGKDAKPRMLDEKPAQLVAHLSSPNGWWRDMAQQLLVQRGDRSVVPALAALATGSKDWRTRLQALWTLDGLGALDAALATRALGDASPDVRAAALRLAERWLDRADVRAAVLAKADDVNWLVRRQLAATLGSLPADTRLQPLLAMIERYDDPIVVDAAISGLRGQEETVLERFVGQPKPNLEAIAMLAATVGKRREIASIQKLLDLAADARKLEPLRTALLNGVVAGIRGGPPAGNEVAGGRAGGGPAPARPVREFELPAQPAAIAALAGGSGALANAAKDVLAVTRWPGKAAPTSAAVRHTPQQEALYASGKALYATLCQGCHMEQGQGADHVGAPLAGSKLVNADPSVVVRILIAGKEGKIGLMPPAGATLSDEDLAGVLTYIRGSWGNQSTPLAPADVQALRKRYADRTTPWTDAELSAGAGK
ncbi:MAG: c-type cytochrome [Sphingobium sp.]|nr:c-type cytochrome [Sphingobium sp.]